MPEASSHTLAEERSRQEEKSLQQARRFVDDALATNPTTLGDFRGLLAVASSSQLTRLRPYGFRNTPF